MYVFIWRVQDKRHQILRHHKFPLRWNACPKIGPILFSEFVLCPTLPPLKKDGTSSRQTEASRRRSNGCNHNLVLRQTPPPLPGRCCWLENHGSVTNDINFIKRHHICMCAKWRQLGSGWLVVKLQCYSKGRPLYVNTQFDQIIKY